MKTFLISLAILIAIGVALAQVINWDKVAEEYEPVTNAFGKVIKSIPSDKEIIESIAEVEAVTVTEEVIVDKWWGKVTKIPVTEMHIDEQSAEISNTNYDWLKTITDVCPPTHKRDIKAALNNDGIIRENEFKIISRSCRDYIEVNDSAAKQELREFVE